MTDTIRPLLVDIEVSLIKLRLLALSTNFNIAAERKVFFDDILAIKQLYADIEALLTNVPIIKIFPATMRMYISRSIHPQQMESWVVKIQQNTITLSKQIDVTKIKEQYVLLDIIVKVLNGDAYFTGCLHATN